MTIKKQPYKYNPFHTSLWSHVDFTIGAEVANAIDVTVSLKDKVGGAELAQDTAAWCFISDDPDGVSVSAAPDSVTAQDGIMLVPYTASQAFLVASNGNSTTFEIRITEAGGADTFYLVVIQPDGTYAISNAITFV
jgi:hypothetical protein